MPDRPATRPRGVSRPGPRAGPDPGERSRPDEADDGRAMDPEEQARQLEELRRRRELQAAEDEARRQIQSQEAACRAAELRRQLQLDADVGARPQLWREPDSQRSREADFEAGS